MKYFLILVLLGATLLSAITNEDIRFLLDKEQFQLLAKHLPDLENLMSGSAADINLLKEYAYRTGNDLLAMKCHYQLALREHSLQDAADFLQMATFVEIDTLAFLEQAASLKTEFTSAEDIIILDYYLNNTPEEEYLEQIRTLRGYNSIIEDLAKAWIDEITVEPSDSLALEKIEKFDQSFPISKWQQVAYYYKLYHLSQLKQFAAMDFLIQSSATKTPAHQFITALFLMSPAYRKAQNLTDNDTVLAKALGVLDNADTSLANAQNIQVLYDTYTPGQWQNRVGLTRIKIGYFQILAKQGLYGDETDLTGILTKGDNRLNKLIKQSMKLSFPDNNRGDMAELKYWQGKLLALYTNSTVLRMAAKNFTQSLVYGAPRKKYDISCLQYIGQIGRQLGVKTDSLTWMRKLVRYKGIIFSEAPFADKRYTRVAVGDYDNDGYDDLLFNGNALYHNDRGSGFNCVSDSTNLAELSSNGALWADLNKDGLLDFATISHAEDGNGEALMKNMDGTRFVKVNEKAGDIDDKYPTEGAAWIDTDCLGYPSYYTANYEKWQQRSGYPDLFWHNDRGAFTNKSKALGFRAPKYTDNPGQAGRGVAPADYDNDGQQEILVTNYRLNRNFYWDRQDSLFADVAALTGLSGKYKEGYYGHSIGADWGDFDNDGDLDVFIANLAHPRYIDISDVSQLLRNDGLSSRVVDADTLWFWKFTDVTKKAGITYDELHSDPLWFDADNDGWLDLFITSVYENDRSYLYHNNGDGTLTDITFLSGARVYNGWGNATADLNRDGLPDLVVGSGNGTRILLNATQTKNRSVDIKPVWKNDDIVLASDWRHYSEYPNSPAFGTRVRITLKSPLGKRSSLIRELSSAKGTTSQSAQELHFGLANNKVISIEKVSYAQDQN
jgi:hypothetical protein